MNKPSALVSSCPILLKSLIARITSPAYKKSKVKTKFVWKILAENAAEVLTYTTNHAGSSPANLKMIFSDLCSVEHSVETGHLVNLHGCHLKDLGNLVHCGKSQEVIVLLLSDKQNRDDTGRFVVVWVLLEKSFDGGV